MLFLEKYEFVMTTFEPISVAFVLRFWLERRQVEGAQPIWRGVVEHVPSGERRYFDSFEDLLNILATYLIDSGKNNQED
jgi:hypothetical protein